jgi:hypothetical protein
LQRQGRTTFGKNNGKDKGKDEGKRVIALVCGTDYLLAWQLQHV